MKRLIIKLKDVVIQERSGPEEELSDWLEKSIAMGTLPEGFTSEYVNTQSQAKKSAIANIRSIGNTSFTTVAGARAVVAQITEEIAKFLEAL